MSESGWHFGVAGGQARHHDIDREELDEVIVVFEEFGGIVFSESSTDMFLGIGAACHFTNSWTVGADYRLLRDVGEELDISSLTPGLSYHF